MKELILNKEGLMLRQNSASTRELTTQARERYSKGGEIFMEGNGEQSPQKPPEQNRETPSNNAEKVVKAGKAWKEYLAKEGQPWESLNTALRRGFMDKINMGEMPPEMKEREAGGEQKARDERQGPPVLTQEAKDIIENVASGGIFLSINARVERILRENGISDDDISKKNPKELIEMLQAKAGGARGGKPPGPPAPPVSSAGAGGADGGDKKPHTASGTSPKEPDNPQEKEPVMDKKAADLIAKFSQEHGESDPAKIQKLRIDLLTRIRELERERDKLGASDGATILEGEKKGELTPAAAAATAELDSQIGEIQGFIADAFSISERTQRGERPLRPEEILVNQTNEYFEGLLSRGLMRSEINDLSKLTGQEKATRAKLVHDIEEFLKDEAAPDTQQFPSHILLAVRHFTELREKLISEIIFKSFEDPSETNEYEVGLYAASNLDILLGFLNQDDNRRYKKLFTLRTATRFFQSMNSTVIKGKFDHFGDAAENINYQHFENMRDITGSGLAMRLYEQAYKDALAIDKKITQDRIAEIKEFVETTFKEDNEAGLIRSKYAEYRTNYEGNKGSKLENWEVQRALAAGRTFFNITLRAAENIATGQVPIDRGKFTSPPQEDMVRILNWNQWLLGRFGIGGAEDGRHGVEFLKMSTDRWEEFLRYKGAKLNKNKIVEFGGVNVRKMEEGGQYRTSGIYSGWRMENMAFDEVYFDFRGNRISVQHFIDKELIPEDILRKLKGRKIVGEQVDEMTVLAAINAFKEAIKKRGQENPSKDQKDLVTQQDQEDYRNILMPVVRNLNIGLSMLLKNSDFGAQDNMLGYLLREEIWKKIANTNTPLMINYLTDIRYADKKAQKEILGDTETIGESEIGKARSIKDLRNAIVPGWSDEQWETFKKKVLIRHERMIQEGIGEEVPAIGENELSEAEKQLVTAIQAEGVKLAPHLADIVFPYMPFMNDMPFEKFNYVKLGQTFYKRRSTNDLGGFNKGQNAYIKIMSNPGGIPVKEAVGAMGEIVEGIATPEGPKVGIEANFPTFSALLDIVTTDPGKRQAIVKMLLEFGRKETSIAQRWSGIKADSFVESEAANLIDETTRAGILTPELARYLKKEKKLTLAYILWMLFRDVFIMVPIFAGAEFVGKITKEK